LRADGIEQLDDTITESTVLLGHSYFLLLDPKQHAKMKPYPPLNTLHAATVLRQEGLSVGVFDAMLANDESDFLASLQQHRPKIVVLFEDNFNFLSKMCLTRMREAALTMIGMAREAGCRVAVCGADVTDHPEVYLEAGAEACLLGEGEHTMREVVSRWLGPEPHQSLADIPGIRFFGPDDRAGALSFNVEGVHQYDLGTLLDQMGVAVRTGHHCCQPLMSRFGITGTVRASFAMYNSQRDVEALAAATQKAVSMLR
jgi:hypothetical protein